MDGAISEIEIDEGLVGYAGFLGQWLKITNRVPVQAHGNRLLEVFGVGIFTPLHFIKVIMIFHDRLLQYSRCSSLSAFRAEMILTTVSLSRKQ